ncbi:hypothetical protein [Nocardia bovistercoris]|uniref:Uncharacterized protein n=1 Tax=Nocardia bovistercoris TaxID=2785916 RepID=A0A931IFR5_9NOCA|nr:hypothetical protein [Nocardia bovistercoris]MBH0779611.1 hypothetical protein [Nocardia bovistercoris]
MTDLMIRAGIVLLLGVSCVGLGYFVRVLQVLREEPRRRSEPRHVAAHQSGSPWGGYSQPDTRTVEIIKEVPDPQQAERIDELEHEINGIVYGLIRAYNVSETERTRLQIRQVLETSEVYPFDAEAGEIYTEHGGRYDAVEHRLTEHANHDRVIAESIRVGWEDRARRIWLPAEVAVWTTDRSLGRAPQETIR